MLVWKEGFRDIYLEELLRWEGRGDAWDEDEAKCLGCQARGIDDPSAGEYRCLDCFLPSLLCQECCVQRHCMLPLHIVEVSILCREGFIQTHDYVRSGLALHSSSLL